MAGISDAGYSRTRGDREITFAQLFYVGQFVERAQTEVIEEKLCRLVKKRATGNFGAATDLDEPALEQSLQNSVDVNAANGLDIGAGDGLAISNNGQRIERRRG